MKWDQSLLEELEEKGWVAIDSSLEAKLLDSWRNHCLGKIQAGHFRPAKIAKSENASIRNDQISWLNTNDPMDISILEVLETFRQQLTEYFRVSAPQIEAHFARYEKDHFYHRHLDQPKGKGNRVFTFVIYLHPEWRPEFGGELAITNGDSDQILDLLPPLPGRVLIFKSDEIWHEVRKSNFHRLSLTGWFRK